MLMVIDWKCMYLFSSFASLVYSKFLHYACITLIIRKIEYYQNVFHLLFTLPSLGHVTWMTVIKCPFLLLQLNKKTPTYLYWFNSTLEWCSLGDGPIQFPVCGWQKAREPDWNQGIQHFFLRDCSALVLLVYCEKIT